MGFPLLALCLALAPAPTAGADEVVAAERLFAATAKEKGVASAFRTFAADDATLFIPDPRPGKKLLDAAPDRPGTLEWFPVYAGIAASGDLGFTTGPFVAAGGKNKRYGQYFTIWRKQADGNWRWVIDHGPNTDEALMSAADSPPALLPISGKRRGRGSWKEVEKAEAALSASLAVDARKAYLSAFGDDARLMRRGPQPASGKAAVAAMLQNQPRQMTAKAIGGGISRAGDLAYTYGDASWNDDAGAQRGHYVRIWQNRDRGWTLVIDSIVPVEKRGG